MRSSSVLERRGPGAPSFLYLSVPSWLAVKVEFLWGTRDITAEIVTRSLPSGGLVLKACYLNQHRSSFVISQGS
ncbi:hypothetical protein Forpe1208_v003474 [Fusarium oxysporum f. sp. rapae]|uniref:Uncharacterized protein n=1 Tax=Fusarium oxysporum f. sp. rapae TaxID=485398 RepID=A0A8J5TZH3_FUSOX|nr:hypothetical protein Forpe1208_v003474 [Fusarium oxysporum f. sp. rapae]